MPHPGPSAGAAPRTLREIALEKGTNPQGFTASPDYDAHGGVPAGAVGGAAGQVYKDVAEAAQAKDIAAPSAVNVTPFTLGGE